MPRPARFTYLVKGKALGAAIHAGLVATWGYICDCVRFLSPGRGVKIDGMMQGRPKIGVEILPGPGIDVACGGDGMPYTISAENGGVCVTSLNGLTGDVEIDASGSTSVGGKTIRLDCDTKDNSISITLKDDEDGDSGSGGDDSGYCNSISADGDGFSGGGMSDGGNAIADSDGLDNDISRDPCNF